MKKALFIFGLLISLTSLSHAQTIPAGNETLAFGSELEKSIWETGKESPFLLFRAVQAESSESEDAWTDLVAELDQKAAKSKVDLNLLRQIFQKSSQRLFKKYEQHSTFNAMLSEGRFDCVSGSAALGMLLERYGFSYDIVETDYHVFIVVDLDGKEIVLESTLPVGGMITTASKVEKYLDAYKPSEFVSAKAVGQRLAGPDIDYSDNSIFRKVSLTQLAGLQYYNDAIVHFNAQAFGPAVEQLSKAYLLYPSDRILGLRELSVDLAYRPLATN